MISEFIQFIQILNFILSGTFGLGNSVRRFCKKKIF